MRLIEQNCSAKNMKNLLFQTLALIMFAGALLGGPPAQISLGKPYRKTFPPVDGKPGSAYIMVPFAITNTTEEPIRFYCYSSDAYFTQYVSKLKNPKRWEDVTMRGLCGMPFSEKSLASGETLKGELWIQPQYSGRKLRLALPVRRESSDSHAPFRVKTDPVLLP